MYLYFQSIVVVKNTGGILVDVKREVKGVFLLTEGQKLQFLSSSTKDCKAIMLNAESHRCSITNLLMLFERSRMLVFHYKVKINFIT